MMGLIKKMKNHVIRLAAGDELIVIGPHGGVDKLVELSGERG